jgi:2-polyprenyl-6-hydroxyphenyl methylase/3-demethylubiquinone-9 3-methyltransferase
MSTLQADTLREPVAFHAQLAADWEQRYRKRSFRARQAVLAECLHGIDVAGSCWLDAGCGTGTLSRWLAERGCHVLGVDAASSMIQAATELAKTQPHKLKFARVETIARLPLEDASQDGVLCSSVLEYVDDPLVCLAEFVRVLKIGGLLVASVPNRDSVIRWAQVACHRLGARLGQDWVPFIRHSRHQYRVEEFARLLGECGLRTEKVLSFGSPMPRPAQRLRWGGSLLMFMARKTAKAPSLPIQSSSRTFP